MKNILFLFILCFACIATTSAQGTLDPMEGDDEITTNDPSLISDGPKMEFESMEVPYGTIDQHSEPLRNLAFTNTGTEPLVIKSARGSCGCTVPIWPKEPIMPGESANIEIRYATDRIGKINKTVTITTNEGGDPHVIKVTGKVNKADDIQSVPKAPASIITGGKKTGE